MIKVFYNLNYQNGSAPKEAKITFHTFSGGEEHVNIENFYTHQIEIRADLTSTQEVMRLLLVTDALRRMIHCPPITLHMPYLPYARQDRVCQTGDSFALKVFCDLINSQKYNKVVISDAHSSVATALLDNVKELKQSRQAFDFTDSYDFIIAPDAGACKKAVDFSETVEWDNEVVQALKVRSKDGNITSTKVLYGDFEGKSCLIVDDICDGGRTFLELAKVLKSQNAGSIALYVTHGIFSQGLDVLFEGGIDFIYTTDSFKQTDSRVKVIPTYSNYLSEQPSQSL